MRSVPVALTIAGSDSSGGAGAQADLKTFGALGVYGLTALTCVVAETPGQVKRIDAVDSSLVREQIKLLLEGFPVASIKTGMLYSAEIAACVAEVLRGSERPLVIDPVMVATSGDLLLQADAIAVYEENLFPLAAVITPNLAEAATLLGDSIASLGEMRSSGRKLFERYGVPILLKGGHLGGKTAVDLLVTEAGAQEFAAPFTREVQTHGTGCTFSAAIAAGLASGLELAAAVERGKRFVSAAIAQHFAWTTSTGNVLHALNHSPNE